MLKTFAFVFARGGSKGIPGKNTRDLAGKPLLAHSLEIAKALPEVSGVFVSTDDPGIARVARDWGVEVVDRPESLATDSSPEWLSWQHAIRWVSEHYGSFSRFVSLPATAPLRNTDDVSRCLQALDQETDVVVSVTEASSSPWFNMVRVENDGQIRLLADGDGQVARRQDAPTIFDMTTVAYVSRPSFILENSGIWQGRVRGVIVPGERALDIDTPLDFKFAEFLIREREARGEVEC
jgi:CMP-N-acetylneuraminic acid synthetase